MGGEGGGEGRRLGRQCRQLGRRERSGRSRRHCRAGAGQSRAGRASGAQARRRCRQSCRHMLHFFQCDACTMFFFPAIALLLGSTHCFACWTGYKAVSPIRYLLPCSPCWSKSRWKTFKLIFTNIKRQYQLQKRSRKKKTQPNNKQQSTGSVAKRLRKERIQPNINKIQMTVFLAKEITKGKDPTIHQQTSNDGIRHKEITKGKNLTKY